MRKITLVHVAAAVALLGASCMRSALLAPADSVTRTDALPDSSGAGGTRTDALPDSSGAGGTKGDTADAVGSDGARDGVVVRSDGGLSDLIGGNRTLGGILDSGILGGLLDAGILGGITDASRSGLLSQAICDSKVKTGDACSSATTPGCILSNLGGLCACLNGAYLCPLNTSQSPQPCPAAAATGTTCLSPLSTCIGGSTTACICGLGSYTCF
jgi:hypothetical protein